MEKLKCKFCGGGELVEMNGTYHCWDCGAKYVIENGELRLLKCKLCIGDLIDCGDHYECDLCGAKYEKHIEKDFKNIFNGELPTLKFKRYNKEEYLKNKEE